MRPAALAIPSAAILALACESGGSRPDPITSVSVAEFATIPGAPVFAGVSDVVATEAGYWVLDAAPPFVTFVPTAGLGRVVRLGLRGGGPGELEAPVSLRPVGGGVEVWDASDLRWILYRIDGTSAVRSDAETSDTWVRPDFTTVSHLDPWRLRTVGGRVVRTVFSRDLTHASHYASGMLVEAGQGAPRRIVAFRDMVPRDARSLGQFPEMPLWDACAGQIVVWEPRFARVRWIDLEGRTLAEVAVPADAVPITTPGIERYLELMARHELGSAGDEAPDLAARAREVRPMFGDTATPFTDLRCDSDGSAWLQEFDLFADPLGRGPIWTRVDRTAGRRTVRFPDGFHPLLFRDGTVLGVLRTMQGDVLTEWGGRTAARHENVPIPLLEQP